MNNEGRREAKRVTQEKKRREYKGVRRRGEVSTAYKEVRTVHESA